MSRNLHLSIPEPCSMRWNQMVYIDDVNRHCLSCDKVITDFTRMSDDELIRLFRDKNVTCGKFAPHQLNRNLGTRKNSRAGLISAFLIPSLLALAELSGQNANPQAVVLLQTDTVKKPVRIPIDAVPTFHDSLMITGRVLETNDSLQEYPLAGALVIFHLSDSVKRGCTTNAEGRFSINLDTAKYGDTVSVEMRYTGYEPYFTTLVLQKEVLMPPVIIRAQALPTHTLGALIVIETPRSKVERFFWRLFRPRHWFRRY